MKQELVGNIVFDTGPVLELLYSTVRGAKIKAALTAEELRGNISDITVAELRYVLCRKLGHEESRTKINSLLESRYLAVHEASKLVETAAEYKCRRNLSLADCFALALAKTIGAPVLFAKKEEDLVREMSKEPLDVEIRFLQQ